VKLLAALLGSAVVCGAVHAVTRRPRPPPPLSALELCSKGGVELIDERCNAGGCAKQSVRLAWNRSGGVLYEGDSTGEEAQRRIPSRELSGLLATLSSLEPRRTDSDLTCGALGCPLFDRALTITSECGAGLRQTFTFMRGRPAWERVRSDCARFEGAELARCTAERAWHAAFATTLAARFDTVFQRLRERGRGE
jgi:hypothetical protein